MRNGDFVICGYMWNPNILQSQFLMSLRYPSVMACAGMWSCWEPPGYAKGFIMSGPDRLERCGPSVSPWASVSIIIIMAPPQNENTESVALCFGKNRSKTRNSATKTVYEMLRATTHLLSKAAYLIGVGCIESRIPKSISAQQ